MKYIKFQIQNFKGIKQLSLDFSANPGLRATTLVGLNESGKTTILEAINLIQRDFEGEGSHSLIPRNNQFSFTGSISVVATLELDEEDNLQLKKKAKELSLLVTKDVLRFSVTKSYNFTKARFVPPVQTEYDFLLVGKSRHAKNGAPEKRLQSPDAKYVEIGEFIDKKLRPPIIFYPNFLADFPERIYLKKSPGEKPRQKEYRQVLQDILDTLSKQNDRLTLNEDILERLERDTEEDKSALESLLSTMGEKITNVVIVAWKNILSSQKEKDILSDLKIIVRPDKEKVTEQDGSISYLPYLEIKVKDGAEPYHISERSLGFRWFFSYFLFTEFRKHRADDRGEILFLIDEPASNLHSTAQLKLVETFKELVKKSRLIYTTHSHHLINPEWLEGAYIVQNKALDYEEKELAYNSSRTDIDALPYRQFVAAHPNQQTYFQPILDKLEYKPSSLENVPDLVVIEGKNDFYTLQYLNKVFLNNQYAELNLCPGNGAGHNGAIIQLYLAWGRNFIVLCDGDSAGKEAKKKYIEDYGKDVEKRIFTLADISSSFNGKAMEGLFSSPAEKGRITQEIFPKITKVSKDRLNQAIQNLLFLGQKTTLNKTSLQNFEKVLTFLKTKLSEAKAS